MNQMTPSNAASAEQSASAREELFAQAQAMKIVVQQLRGMAGSEDAAGQTGPPVFPLDDDFNPAGAKR